MILKNLVSQVIFENDEKEVVQKDHFDNFL